jgi:hypothetical protein
MSVRVQEKVVYVATCDQCSERPSPWVTRDGADLWAEEHELAHTSRAAIGRMLEGRSIYEPKNDEYVIHQAVAGATKAGDVYFRWNGWIYDLGGYRLCLESDVPGLVESD